MVRLQAVCTRDVCSQPLPRTSYRVAPFIGEIYCRAGQHARDDGRQLCCGARNGTEMCRRGCITHSNIHGIIRVHVRHLLADGLDKRELHRAHRNIANISALGNRGQRDLAHAHVASNKLRARERCKYASVCELTSNMAGTNTGFVACWEDALPCDCRDGDATRDRLMQYLPHPPASTRPPRCGQPICEL